MVLWVQDINIEIHALVYFMSKPCTLNLVPCNNVRKKLIYLNSTL